MLLAQVTDTHCRPEGETVQGVDSNAMLEACVADLGLCRPVPGAIVVTGDLTDCGLEAEYQAIRRRLARLGPPVYVIPGNHDRRENLRAAFAGEGYLPSEGDKLCYAADLGPLRLLALDSLVPGQEHGEIGERQLAWLEARLAEAPGRPSVVAVHHPPIVTGMPGMDAIGLVDAAALGQVVGRHRNVLRILSGHHHRPIQALWHGTLASVCPGTAHQVHLDLEPERPARVILEPPAYQLHLWNESAGLITHTRYVGDYGGPFDFELDEAYPGFRAAAELERD